MKIRYQFQWKKFLLLVLLISFLWGIVHDGLMISHEGQLEMHSRSVKNVTTAPLPRCETGNDDISSIAEPTSIRACTHNPQFNTSNEAQLRTVSCRYFNKILTFPKFPKFIIVGAQKAGTTALYEILSAIPDLLPTMRKEPHFWDALVSDPGNWTTDVHCAKIKEYISKWNASLITPSSILFEKTPSLLAIPRIPNDIQEVLRRVHPDLSVKIVVVLRDPVERFHSQYKMNCYIHLRRNPYLASVEGLVHEEVRELIQNNIVQAPPYEFDSGIQSKGNEWNKEEFSVGEPSLQKYTGYIARGLYQHQLPHYLKYFTLNHSLKVIEYETFRQRPEEVLKDLLFFATGQNITLSSAVKERILEDWRPKKQSESVICPPFHNHTRRYLQHLYRPFNEKLGDLLGESWRDVWKYED